MISGKLQIPGKTLVLVRKKNNLTHFFQSSFQCTGFLFQAATHKLITTNCLFETLNWHESSSEAQKQKLTDRFMTTYLVKNISLAESEFWDGKLFPNPRAGTNR